MLFDACFYSFLCGRDHITLTIWNKNFSHKTNLSYKLCLEQDWGHISCQGSSFLVSSFRDHPSVSQYNQSHFEVAFKFAFEIWNWIDLYPLTRCTLEGIASICFISRLIISKNCGCRSKSLRGVKRLEKLWGISNYPLPGWPSAHHWVKSSTIIENTKNWEKKS